jgi:hypothetical protein
VLAGGHDLIRHVVARDHMVLLRQEFHRKMDAGELPTRHRKVAREFRASGKHHRIEFRGHQLRIDVNAHVLIHAKLDALGAHLRDAPVDQVFLHFEIGNAITQKAAWPIGFFEHDHTVTGARELLRAREPCGPRPDHRNSSAGCPLGRRGLNPAHFPRFVCDRVLDRLDSYGVVIDVQRARSFARCRTHATGELGKIVSGM